ncbi:MAG: GNAT family N-acetyltransferase [Flavobacteriaceae bacterium]
MTIALREAIQGDLNKLRVFEQNLIQYERPFASNLKEDPIEYYDLSDLIKRPDARVVVAEVSGEIVGSGYALIKRSVEYKKPDTYAYLGFMYVIPEFRGKGVNGTIIDDLAQWAKKQNINELQLDVYAENKAAISAYSKRNFKADLLKMRWNFED